MPVSDEVRAPNAAAWQDPTPEMLSSPEFQAVWNVIKTWDVAVPEQYVGYCGATGNHVRAILDALATLRTPTEDEVEAVARAIYEAEPLPEGLPAEWFGWEAQKAYNGRSWLVYERARAAIAAIAAIRPTQDAARMVEALNKLLPVSWDNEVDPQTGEPVYATLTFGNHSTQAMTMDPETWMVLNELPAVLARQALTEQPVIRDDEVTQLREALQGHHGIASGPCQEGFRVSVYYHTPEGAAQLNSVISSILYPSDGDGHHDQ